MSDIYLYYRMHLCRYYFASEERERSDWTCAAEAAEGVEAGVEGVKRSTRVNGVMETSLHCVWHLCAE